MLCVVFQDNVIVLTNLCSVLCLRQCVCFDQPVLCVVFQTMCRYWCVSGQFMCFDQPVLCVVFQEKAMQRQEAYRKQQREQAEKERLRREQERQK